MFVYVLEHYDWNEQGLDGNEIEDVFADLEAGVAALDALANGAREDGAAVVETEVPVGDIVASFTVNGDTGYVLNRHELVQTEA